MSDKQKEEPEVPIASETGEEETSFAAMSRRRFLGSAAVGAAGLALALKSPESAFAQQENGEVTVDGILITILSAPLGSLGSSSWTVTQTFSSTFTLRSDINATLSLGASVTSSSGSQTTGTFTVGGSTSFSQSRSVQVTDAISIRRTINFGVNTQTPGTIGNTLFLAVSSPKLNFKGDPTRLLWKFINNSAGGFLALSVSELQAGIWDSVIRPSTRDSWLALYPLLADPSGATLVKPRFKKRQVISVSAGASVPFSIETAEGASFATNRTSSFTAEITESVGFTTGTPPGGTSVRTTFQVGNKITVSMTSVQEVSSTRIVRFNTLLQRSTPGTFIIYKDKVFKTWFVVDAGPPASSGQPVVTGVVNGSAGGVVAGAVVKLTQGNTEYIAAADAAGNYRIASPAGHAMIAGSFPMVVGTVNQIHNVTNGQSIRNFFGVPTGPATTHPEYLETAVMTE